MRLDIAQQKYLHQTLAKLADHWEDNSLSEQLWDFALSEGPHHQLMAGQMEKAIKKLTDYATLNARLTKFNSDHWVDDVELAYQVSHHESNITVSSEISAWRDFAKSNAHILRRGDENWQTNKILLQLACEYGIDNPVTLAAKSWLATDKCDWYWIRSKTRLSVQSNIVFEGHANHIIRAFLLKNGSLLSEATRGNVRIWDLETGKCQVNWSIGEYADIISELDNNLLLSRDHNKLNILNQKGEYLYSWEAHKSDIEQIIPLQNGRLLTGAKENSEALHLWDHEGNLISVFDNADGSTYRMIDLHDGFVLGWSQDRIQVWNGEKGGVQASHLFTEQIESLEVVNTQNGIEIIFITQDLKNENFKVNRWVWFEGKFNQHKAIDLENKNIRYLHFTFNILTDDRAVSYRWASSSSRHGDEREIVLWNLATGKQITQLKGNQCQLFDKDRLLTWNERNLWFWTLAGEQIWNTHVDGSDINNIRILEHYGILGWGYEKVVKLWDASTGQLICTFPIQTTSVLIEVISLNNGDFITYSERSLQRWSTTGLSLQNPVANYPMLDRSRILSTNNRILSFPSDKHEPPRIWDVKTGDMIASLQAHSDRINGWLLIEDHQVLTWSTDEILVLWDLDTGKFIHEFRGHKGSVKGVLLIESKALSWSSDKTLRIWDLKNPSNSKILGVHKDPVEGASLLSSGLLLSWCNSEIKTWNLNNNACIWEVHDKSISGVFELSGNRIITWSKSELTIWDQNKTYPIQILNSDTDFDSDMMITELSEQSFITWFPLSPEIFLWLIDGQDYRRINLINNNDKATGAYKMPNGDILTCTNNTQDYGKLESTLYLWDQNGNPKGKLSKIWWEFLHLGKAIIINDQIFLLGSFKDFPNDWALLSSEGNRLEIKNINELAANGKTANEIKTSITSTDFSHRIMNNWVYWQKENPRIIGVTYQSDQPIRCEWHGDDFNCLVKLSNKGEIIGFGRSPMLLQLYKGKDMVPFQ
jgi:hypothetical protein